MSLSQYSFSSQGDSHFHFPSLCLCPCFLSLSPYPAGSARYFCLILCSSLWCQLHAPHQLNSFCHWTPFLMTHSSCMTYLVTPALSSLKLDGELFISWMMSFYLSHKAYMAFMGAMQINNNKHFILYWYTFRYLNCEILPSVEADVNAWLCQSTAWARVSGTWGRSGLWMVLQ